MKNSSPYRKRIVACIAGMVLVASPLLASAAIGQANLFGMGRLLGTGAVTAVDGAAGGGINPWAVISGYGTNQQIGATAFYSHVLLNNYNMDAYGASVGLFNRIELSFARQSFSLGNTGATLDHRILDVATGGNPPAYGTHTSTALGLSGPTFFGTNYQLNQDIVGLKVRLFGNIIYDQNWWEPQVSVGVDYHHSEMPKNLAETLHVTRNAMSYYLSATKVWLHGIFGLTTLADVNIQVTNANQQGLLGFGGVNGMGYKVLPAAAVGVFLNRHVVLGGEYRAMPQNQLIAPSSGAGNFSTLGNAVSKTSAWKDVYVAWFPYKQLSLTAAYVNLGTIATEKSQSGLYLSLTTSF
ncbi:DUF3034 family protein [Acidithiobacillus sp. CV18-2]|uniref:DUF3034 family protein n=1 Tax=Igneacidithiobacillus copahuensis TaxID=2724909 RepID=A0AAE2YMH3_9PROT|nr:DUF3034 family protein [Igneacidithiobacillus copahuensis]MBU2755416.1 DUF3034 family protein [Acidithiobacillus sp. CV18-3]MBU2757948.1 DUF3034 family protein [Acidithiobacillus sp. BN09-2]MBU2778313.1 DUF3034 family protein [Acidithiobacillus sp. CV18-2]MBU2797149.1 DUF3034 family protein [Acidithiobacillus sp. VAN18-2]MBU2798565.1 DUF3034 family protein [Acidithiobacillus sp. VAN18-4]UTV81502.1 DUF3034 family protein [Acidithiobacillus sp. YTS05]